MNTVTKDVILETMQSKITITEKAETIAGQMVWLDGLTKETVTEALVLVMQQCVTETAAQQINEAELPPA